MSDGEPVTSGGDREMAEETGQRDAPEEAPEAEQEPKRPNPLNKLYTDEQIKNCPTVFQALGMEQNRNVLIMLGVMSALVAAVAFGVFLIGREMIPVYFPSISRYDSPIYACGASVVATHIVVFAFYFWAWKHDTAEEAKTKVD